MNINKICFFSFIVITFLILFNSLVLESKTTNELNIYSGRKSFLIEPLINEFKRFPLNQSKNGHR